VPMRPRESALYAGSRRRLVERVDLHTTSKHLNLLDNWCSLAIRPGRGFVHEFWPSSADEFWPTLR
jgi:hypothetical protein